MYYEETRTAFIGEEFLSSFKQTEKNIRKEKVETSLLGPGEHREDI
jgi:hypothetical protein